MPLRLKGIKPAPGDADRRYYMLDVQEGHRRERHSTGTRDRDIAERREQGVLDALRGDPSVTRAELALIARGGSMAALRASRSMPAEWSFKQACDSLLSTSKRDGGLGDAAALDSYITNAKMLQKHIAPALSVSRIDQKILDATAAAIVAENSEATCNRKLYLLMRVLTHAQTKGHYAGALPVWKKHNEDNNAREFVLTHQDEAVLFAAIAALDDREVTVKGGHPVVRDAADYLDVFTFLADIGCRHSQAYRVLWRDIVELQPGVFGVRFWRKGEQKGGKARTIPCTDRVAEMLGRRRSGGGTGPFIGMSRFRATKLWATAKALTYLADEPECVPHALRHTCATRLLERTGNLKLAQEWLGHTKIETTANIYAKVTRQGMVDALGALAPSTGMSPIPTSGASKDRNLSLLRDSSKLKH